MFRVYQVTIVLNETLYKELWIDPHYEIKHGKSISDDLILNLLLQVNNSLLEPAAESYGFSYYEVDVEYRKKLYRLILVIPNDDSYLGVRNSYRRSK